MAKSMHWRTTRAIEAPLSRANAKNALPFSPVSTLWVESERSPFSHGEHTRIFPLLRNPHLSSSYRALTLTPCQLGRGHGDVQQSICVAQLRATEGVLALRFPWHGDVSHALRELGLPRMVAVDDDNEFAWLNVLRDREDYSVVCLTGQNGRDEGIEKAEGCGHSIGWEIWFVDPTRKNRDRLKLVSQAWLADPSMLHQLRGEVNNCVTRINKVL